MERDAISANVAKGGLKNTAEIKILVLYLLMNVNEPVPSNQIADLLHILMVFHTIRLHSQAVDGRAFSTVEHT